jgi:mono/diheme cytochrome c family protein
MVSNYSFRYAFSFLLMSLFLSIGITNAQDVELSLSTDAAVIKNGEEIFETNCVSCHDIDKKKVGPALKGVYDRRELSWIIGFVKAPQKTIESGDEQAVALYEEFQSSGYMPNHNFLKDEEILAVISYVKNPPVKAKTTVVATDDIKEEGISKGLLIAIIAALGGMLLFVLFALTAVSSVLTQSLKKDGVEGEEVDSGAFNIRAIFANSTVQAVIGFVFVAVIAKASLAGLFAIGVQQGYAPDQPIPFSHKLHAGEYEIDCKYCHTGALRGKNAGIPSSNICMNCHNTIKNTSPEIQKIYKAIETDTPIQWVRVHNLPDLAYFNHSQHVVVAGLECQTCHGEIQEMEVVQQLSKLTMGWCIDCHRKTDVKTKGNAYYDNLVQLHKESSKEPLKVEDIGGLECSKCHY